MEIFGLLGFALCIVVIVVPIISLSKISGLREKLDELERQNRRMGDSLSRMSQLLMKALDNRPVAASEVDFKPDSPPAPTPQPQPAKETERAIKPHQETILPDSDSLSETQMAAVLAKADAITPAQQETAPEPVTVQTQASPAPAAPFQEVRMPQPIRQKIELVHATKPSRPVEVAETSRLETEARRIMHGIWNWIIVGDQHQKANVTREFAVASNWLLRIGIIFTLAGIGYFLKYSIENGWLPPAARVMMATLTGTAMVVGGIRILKGRYGLMGQGLMGGGVATIFFSIFAAYELYDRLIPFGPAFALMGLVTLAASGLAIRYNTLLVAILGILGGFATPILLSTGSNNLPGLFSYMLLLNIGICSIMARKKWYLLNYLGMAMTYGISCLAIHSSYKTDHFWSLTLLLTAFFLVFSVMTYLHNIVRRERSNLMELVFLLLNAVAYFGLAYPLIGQRFDRPWPALLPLGMSAFYLLHVRAFLINKLVDRELLVCFMGLSAVSLSISIPLALSAQWITVSWSAQALAILWMSLKLRSRFLRQMSMLLYAIMLVRFVGLDLHSQFNGHLRAETFSDYLPLLLQHILTFGAPIGSLIGAWKLLSSPPAASAITVGEQNDTVDILGENPTLVGLLVAGLAMAFLYVNLEVHQVCTAFFPGLNATALTFVWVMLAAFLLKLYNKTGSAILQKLLLFACGAIIIKLVFYDMGSWRFFREHPWQYAGAYNGLDATMRLLDFGAIIALLSYGWKSARSGELAKVSGEFMGVTALGLFFIWSTMELHTCLAHFIPGLKAGAVSILWTVYALGLVLSGILKNLRNFRRAGLLMFAIVTGKIFFVDLSRLDAIWKIVAFIVLGILILLGSFAYLHFHKRFTTGEVSKEG